MLNEKVFVTKRKHCKAHQTEYKCTGNQFSLILKTNHIYIIKFAVKVVRLNFNKNFALIKEKRLTILKSVDNTLSTDQIMLSWQNLIFKSPLHNLAINSFNLA